MSFNVHGANGRKSKKLISEKQPLKVVIFVMLLLFSVPFFVCPVFFLRCTDDNNIFLQTFSKSLTVLGAKNKIELRSFFFFEFFLFELNANAKIETIIEHSR